MCLCVCVSVCARIRSSQLSLSLMSKSKLARSCTCIYRPFSRYTCMFFYLFLKVTYHFSPLLIALIFYCIVFTVLSAGLLPYFFHGVCACVCVLKCVLKATNAGEAGAYSCLCEFVTLLHIYQSPAHVRTHTHAHTHTRTHT